MRLYAVVSVMILGTILAGQAPTKAPAKQAAPDQPKFKAIWEPVNFQKDIELKDISCRGPEECWAVGDKSTIIHTKDGGKTWEVQLGGDPGSTDKDMDEVFFLDTSHGWASRTDDMLLYTSDGGASWSEIGKQPLGGSHYQFVSPQVGYAVHWNNAGIFRTGDGGRTWRRHAACKVSFQAEGLAREGFCGLRDMDFPTPTSGYVTGLVEGVRRGIVGTSKDGGNTWTFSSPDILDNTAEKGFFWGDNGGMVGLFLSKSLLTTDGGASWTPIITPVPAYENLVASADGKFIVAMDRRAAVTVAYSTNGGKTFSGRPFRIPATPNELTFFDSQHGYLVGGHGMVYRYRIVPIAYKAAGMIDAPAAAGQ